MQVDPTIRETTQTAQTIPHHNPLGDENSDDNRHGPHVHLDRLVAIIDIEEHTTKIVRKPYPTDRTTTPIEANDPAPEAVNTNRSDVVTSSNPSSRAHRLEVPERPDRKPPDQR